jgi:hypothetical protein
MPILVQVVFGFLALMSSTIGGLMLFVPDRYPKLYQGFLRENIMRRQHTEKDRILAIRTQGLIGLACGALFGFFVWSLR